ncbi:hypothetical protein ACFXGG_06845 [Streptomyces nigra]|uniref:hypothetical protein n=1 Tax=Streptomyces nigra TaxID=1827580 RepID=UPI003685AE7E
MVLPVIPGRLAASDPHLTVTTVEGTTPGLTRALRAGSIDLAVLTSRPPHRPPDDESPRLHTETSRTPNWSPRSGDRRVRGPHAPDATA